MPQFFQRRSDKQSPEVKQLRKTFGFWKNEVHAPAETAIPAMPLSRTHLIYQRPRKSSRERFTGQGHFSVSSISINECPVSWYSPTP